jgi:hypothetical protein
VTTHYQLTRLTVKNLQHYKGLWPNIIAMIDEPNWPGGRILMGIIQYDGDKWYIHWQNDGNEGRYDSIFNMIDHLSDRVKFFFVGNFIQSCQPKIS